MNPKLKTQIKTVAIVQARLGSTRLPGKVLADIAGKTMLQRVVDRLEACQAIDEIVIATTTEPSDGVLVEYCKSNAWNVFAGSEFDVLSRYVEAAGRFDADQIVRITSDCPLIDPTTIDRTVNLLSSVVGVDYASNVYPHRRFPRGLDCEVITREALMRVDQLANDKNYREHVTLFAYRHPDLFTTASINCENDWSDLRWTVDTPEDLKLVASIYEHFSGNDLDFDFDWKDVIAAYATNPQWREINQHCLQKTA